MMNYIVMECHPSYAVLLDEEGRFLKAANLHYEVGQTVLDPVLMKEGPSRQRNRRYWAARSFAAVAACFFMLIGLRYYQNNMAVYSSIYLTINPEVQMELNMQGNVIRLAGTNEDGRELLEGYDGKGKDKITVTDELIDRAIAMGFLSEGGQISFSIDTPDETLFQEYGAELRDEVVRHLQGRFTITVEIVNYQTGETESTEETAVPAAEPETAAPSEQETAPAAEPETAAPSEQETAPAAEPEAAAPSEQETVPASDDTDYGPNNDGVTDYNDTDYGPNNDGVTDYTPPAETTAEPPVTDSGDSGYGDSNYDDGDSSYSDDDNDDDD